MGCVSRFSSFPRSSDEGGLRAELPLPTDFGRNETGEATLSAASTAVRSTSSVTRAFFSPLPLDVDEKSENYELKCSPLVNRALLPTLFVP
jgi:hypothetical protein